MDCNLCGISESTIIYTKARNEVRNILKCNNCGLVFLENENTKEDTEMFYRAEYRRVSTLPIQTPNEHYNDPVTKKDVESQLKFILSKSKVKGMKILEIGSASGGLLEQLNDLGATVSGIELNDEYREFSKSRGLNIFSRPIEYLAYRNKQYDLIVSFHVLEHFSDPSGSIRAIYSSLKTDGLLIGEVPNNNEWGISILDSEVVKRLHYNSHHNYYFTESTLNKYLYQGGFTETKIETIERYNSLEQLRRILSNQKAIDEIEKSVFPKNSEEDLRLRIGNEKEQQFNKFFGDAVNRVLKGNCIRFVAKKTTRCEGK